MARTQKMSQRPRIRGFLYVLCVAGYGLAGASGARAASTAVRSFDVNVYVPTQPVQVMIQVTPDAATLAWAGEDKPPTGWTVLSISHSGGWDAVNGKVKWGPFFDTQARVVTYVATPPAGETGAKTFSGRFAFNGNGVNTTGATTLSRDPAAQYQLSTGVVGGHGTLLPVSGGTYDAGTIVALTATPESGYRVQTWVGTDNDSSTASTNTVTMSSDKAVTVSFEVIPAAQYTVSVAASPSSGGAVSRAPDQATYTAGTTVTLTPTANAGYEFDHWEGDLAGAANPASVVVNGDKAVTAVFMPMYTVSAVVSPVGAGSVSRSPDQASYRSGTNVVLTAAANSGYLFDHWEGDLSGAANPATIAASANRTVTAVFVRAYALTALVTPIGGGSVSRSPDGALYASGTVVTLTATPSAGYRVKGWTGSDDDASVANTNTVTMTADRTVTVEFELAPVTQYQLTTGVVGGHGTLSPPSGAYDAGTVVALTAAPESGYRVKAWGGTSDDASTGTSNSVMMDGAKSVTVEFELIPVTQYQLTTAVVGGHGTLSPSSGAYDAGTVVALTATPESGYRVKAWSGTSDDASTGTSNSVTMTAAKSVTVEFELIPVTQYQLTTGVVGGHGTLSPSSGAYDAGAVVALTATPESGYRVKVWTGTDDDSSVGTSNAVTVNGPASVTVTFEQIPSPPPGGGGGGGAAGQAAAPSTPTDGVATASQGQIEVKWVGGDPSVTGYELQRRTEGIAIAAAAGDAWVELAKLAAQVTAYVDKTVQPGTTYRYRVRALAGAVAGAWLELDAVAMPPAPTPPSAPVDVTLTGVSHSQVSLAWTDTAADETAFVIHRKAGDGEWQPLATLGPDTVAYADSTVSPETAYAYRIAASNDIGLSEWATSSGVVTPAAPVSPSSPAAASVPDDVTDDAAPMPMGFCGAGVVEGALTSLLGLCVVRSLGRRRIDVRGS